MYKKWKRLAAGVMAGMMFVGCLTFGAPVAKADEIPASSFAYVSIDQTTRGQWNGVYGKDGYILFGYAAEAHETDVINVNQYENDLFKKPDYVDPIGEDGYMYQLNDATQIKVRPLPADASDILDIPVDENGTGITTKVEAAIEVGEDAPDIFHAGQWHGNAGRRTLTFHLNDNETHYFTVYSTKPLHDRWFGFEDLEGEALLPLARGGGEAMFNDYAWDSTYVTFTVQGSFQFHYDGGWEDIGLQGVFFDTPEPEAEDASGIFLGTDSVTSGQWHDKYGKDGYILVGYNTSVVPLEQNWSTIDASPDNDIQALPDYVDEYSYEYYTQVVLPPLSDSDRYYNYTTDMPPGNPATTDEVIAGEPRKKYKAYARMNGASGAYTFILNDDEEHIFSLYSRQREMVLIQLTDLEGGVLSERSVASSTFDNGGYVSFIVQGSFKIVIHTASHDFGATSFYFDTPLQDHPSNLEAEAIIGRKASISWSNQGNPDKLILERRQGAGRYMQLAVLDGSVQSYEDSGLQQNRSYSYRLRNVKGTDYGTAAGPVDIHVPAMIETVLSIADTEPIAVSAGQQVTVSATSFKNEDGWAPLANAEVKLRLRGKHVGDGVGFGQEIPEVAAIGVTDESGEVELSFEAEYTGSFSLIATLDPDDVNNLADTVSNEIQLSVQEVVDNSAPFIFKVTDAAKPGKLLNVNGHALHADTVEIRIAPAGAEAPSAEPPGSAITLGIVQKDRSGFFAVAELPEDLEPGVYHIWAGNEHGWSAPALVNGARPLFISDYEAYEGIDIQLAGRNFMQEEFGGDKETQVRLNDGAGKQFSVTIKSLNPYGMTFTVGAADPGEYRVEVSNDGGLNWASLDNGQTLAIVPEGDDPLGLGVAWARDFNWQNRYDVTDFGAIPDDELNDTAAVQAAVDAAEENGGVVYFPEGNYYIDTVDLPRGVVLEGAGMDLTKLYYTGTTGKNFIDSTSYEGIPELQGVARLSLLLTDDAMRPDSFIWIGEAWGGNFGDMTMRQASRVFVSEVKVEYPTATNGGPGSGRGIGIEFIAKERVLIRDNHFTGWHAQPFITAVNQYYVLSNNHFEYTKGFVVGLSTFAFYTDNTVIAVNPEANEETHGLFARSNAYIAGNVIENMGDHSNVHNDGEAIALEIPNAIFNYGKVLKGSENTIHVAPVKPLYDPTLEFGALSILIVEGKGTGQLRKVSDRSGNLYTVEQPFDVVPDSTSRFALITPNDNATIYDNTIVNNAKGIWLFGNSFDSVVAANTSIDSEGIFMYTVRNNDGLSPGYYTRIADNHVEGISRRSDHGGIGFTTGRNDNANAYAIDVFATEIVNNFVSGDNTVAPTGGRTEAPGYGGIYAISASHSSMYDGVLGSGDSTNTIIEDNTLSNLGTGVDLTHSSYGIIVRGNRYDAAVLQFINDTGSVNTLVENNTLYDSNESGNPGGPTGPLNPQNPDQSGKVVVKAQPDASGKTTVIAPLAAILSVLRQGGVTEAVIEVEGGEDASEVTLSFDYEAVKEAVRQGVAAFRLHIGLASVTIDSALLEAAGESGSVELKVALVPTEELSDEAKERMNGNPVFNFVLSVGGKVLNQFPNKGVKVEWPYTLSANENGDQVVIYYIDENGRVYVVLGGKYEESSKMVSFAPDHFSQYGAAHRPVHYNDLGSVHWAEASIRALTAREIVEGVGEGRFQPGKVLTRAEFITILARTFKLEDEETDSAFSDVQAGSWYEGAVSGAKRLGIVNGNPDGTFAPHDPVTRQDMAVMLHRTLEAVQWLRTPNSADHAFADGDAIASYAREAANELHALGIIQGTGNGKFEPLADATRAQAAVMIWNLIGLLP